MTGQPQYIITEQQIKSFEKLLHKKLPIFRERPYQSEREKVLDKDKVIDILCEMCRGTLSEYEDLIVDNCDIRKSGAICKLCHRLSEELRQAGEP